MKRVCSLRDVLVEKRDPIAYEQRVLDKLNAALRSAADSFGRHVSATESRHSARVADIRIPIFYTGFVTRKPAAGAADQAFGKNSAFDPANRATSSWPVPAAVAPATGCWKALPWPAGNSANPVPFNWRCLPGRLWITSVLSRKFPVSPARGSGSGGLQKTLLDYLDAADLSISMAGYNTCMDLLVLRMPALVYPYARQREQPIRAERIKHLLPMKILGDHGPGP